MVAVVLAIITNLMFTMYHLYMRRKSEYQTRLLNILFCHLALTLQSASIINVLTVVSQIGKYFQLKLLSLSEVFNNPYISIFYLQIENIYYYCSSISSLGTFHCGLADNKIFLGRVYVSDSFTNRFVVHISRVE